MDREAPPASTVSYCRKARRLRARLGGDPGRLHRQLGRLSIKSEPDASPGLAKVWRLGRKGMSVSMGRGMSMPAEGGEGERYTLLDPAEPVEDVGYPSTEDRSFREFVERTLAGQRGDVLRYSQRLELLKEAGARGIGRFEANLIIASVQHRLQITSGRGGERRGRKLALSGVLAFVLVQGLIVLGYWRLLRS